MTVWLVSGVLLGAAASTHCAAMCGPIASGVTMLFAPASLAERARLLAIAQAGRIAAYALAGLALGGLGSGVAQLFDRAEVYEVLRLVAAATLTWSGLAVAGLAPPLAALDPILRPIGALVGVGARRLAPIGPAEDGGAPVLGPFLAGLAWGLAPCAMVYGALVTALVTGSALGGFTLMAGFGLGTALAVFGSGLAVSSLAGLRPGGRVRVAIGLAIATLGLASPFAGAADLAALCGF